MERKYKILIVDDDLLIHRIWTTILTGNGYDVVTSESAMDILDIVEQHGPDIIIMDHQMPVVSGAEAIKQLKADGRYRLIPVVLFSSVFDLGQLAKESGADTYISKAKSHHELVNAINIIKGQLMYSETHTE